MVTQSNLRDIPTLPLLDDSDVFQDSDAVALFISIFLASILLAFPVPVAPSCFVSSNSG